MSTYTSFLAGSPFSYGHQSPGLTLTSVKAPHPNTVILGARASIYRFWGDTIQSIKFTIIFYLVFIKLKSYKPKPCMNLLFIKKNYLEAYCLLISFILSA